MKGKVNGRVRDCSLGTLLRSLRVGGEERQRFSIRPRFDFASGECISCRANAGRTLMNILPILTTARPSPERARFGPPVRSSGVPSQARLCSKSVDNKRSTCTFSSYCAEKGRASRQAAVSRAARLDIVERRPASSCRSAMIPWAGEALELFKKLFRENRKYFLDFASFESNFVSLVRSDGALDLYDGLLRAKDSDGRIIFDKVQPRDYLSVIREEVRPWSYMKFPFIHPLGKEKGWYRVGPLARLNNCDFIDTPLAEEERREFLKLGEGRPVHATLAYHWARLIETLHAAEKMKELLSDPDLQGVDLVVSGTRRGEGAACIEAPRGTLFHHYRVRSDDTIEMANLIVSTTSNNEPMNRAVQRVAQEELSGRQITEGLLNKVEVAIRAFDPCLSCATHALGRMALEGSLVDSRGRVVDRKVRGQT